MEEDDVKEKEVERLLRIAEIKMDNKDYFGAIKIYNSIIDQDSQNPWSFWERGLAKKNAKDTNGAIKDFSACIELDPNNSFAYYQRGLIKEKNGDKNGSEADFNKVKTIRANNKVQIKMLKENDEHN